MSHEGGTSVPDFLSREREDFWSRNGPSEVALEIDRILTADTGEEAGKRGAGSQPGSTVMWTDGDSSQNSGYNSKALHLAMRL